MSTDSAPITSHVATTTPTPPVRSWSVDSTTAPGTAPGLPPATESAAPTTQGAKAMAETMLGHMTAFMAMPFVE
jgi:hypothetical protein